MASEESALGKLKFSYTFSPERSRLYPIDVKLKCCNEYQYSVTLRSYQAFTSTLVIVPTIILDTLSEDQLKGWGLLSEIYELNDERTAFDEKSHERVVPLDVFKSSNNAQPIFEERKIKGTASHIVLSIKKVNSEGKADKGTTFKEIYEVFSQFEGRGKKAIDHSIMLKGIVQ